LNFPQDRIERFAHTQKSIKSEIRVLHFSLLSTHYITLPRTNTQAAKTKSDISAIMDKIGKHAEHIQK
jgi:hypothetical protein